MNSVKLTDHLRGRLKTVIIGNRFDARIAAFSDRERELAIKIYEDHYTAGDLNTIKSLPAGWLPRVDSIRVKIGNETESLHLKGTTLPVLNKDREYGYGSRPLRTLDSSGEFGRLFFAIKTDEQSLQQEQLKLEAEINGVLNSVTTSARLIAVWPEIKWIVENVCRITSDVNLPAPRVDYLNKVLGLPPKVEASPVEAGK